jgi:hypothetical protein
VPPHRTSSSRALSPFLSLPPFFLSLRSFSKALWLDGPKKARALILWRPLTAWADAIAAWAKEAGMAGQVVTVDELGAEEAKGTGVTF